MICLYLWAVHLELSYFKSDDGRYILWLIRRYYYDESPVAFISGVPLQLLVYAPYTIYVLALALLVLLAVRPRLICSSKRYALLLSYTLASWVTASISPGSALAE